MPRISSPYLNSRASSRGKPLESGEFWTSGQRKGCPLHEISYRACFKPQVPGYFIERLTKPGDVVYDPFMGRGTTILEAVLSGRRAIGNDINPLSTILLEPRLSLPAMERLEERLETIVLTSRSEEQEDLSMFFHRKTLGELASLRSYLTERSHKGREDHLDRWIRMIATNRLTGHSPGFFSVYTLPPNQAASRDDQRRINRLRKQRPSYRNVKELILRKSRRILQSVTQEERTALSDSFDRVMLLCKDARETKDIVSESVQLTVTSPPFLDIVDYAKDNWLRCWFNGIPLEQIERRITRTRSVEEWSIVMGGVFGELWRVTRSGGYVAFEVGEVRKKSVKLDEIVVPLGLTAGFVVDRILINLQNFTKTSHIWGVRNNVDGTNTNRIVVFRKPLRV